MRTTGSLKPKKQNADAGTKTFKPAHIGITDPSIDKMGGASMSGAAKQVRKIGRAGIVGRKISLR